FFQSYIVYLGSHYFGPNPSLVDLDSVTDSHHDFLGPYVGSIEKAKEAIFYSYNRYINGFAAVLEEDEAANIAEHPSVVSVFLNKKRKLHTTHSWNFLGLERNGGYPEASAWRKTLGEDVIIGNLDTGVWPESKSFSDEGLGPIPKRWRGICQTHKKAKDKFQCNRKLIGARYFYKGYEANFHIKLNESLLSARDNEGHGSHTLSTAGGSFVPGANVMAAFEAAISDGVDVLSMSLGSEAHDYFEDGIAIGSFHAVANGIVVVASAGNSGPFPESVSNVGPWMLTVAASTIDRDFASYVTLGDKKIIKGGSLSEYGLSSDKAYPLISSADAKYFNGSISEALNCQDGCLDPEKVKGKILVCFGDRLESNGEAIREGAVGLLLLNERNAGNEVLPQPYLLPAANVGFEDGNYIYNYIRSTKSPTAYISRVITELGVKPAPNVALFSSRGPNHIDPAILKPDITAPGFNIIAAYTEAVSATGLESDTRITPFFSMTGTSMSCPHVAGLAGLLKALHPNWSPAAIKSAIMTSATSTDNSRKPIQDSSLNEATPFDYGAGHIKPNSAVDPGLVYDLNITDFLNYLCGRGYNSSQLKMFNHKPYTCPESFSLADFNYPAITISEFGPGNSVNVSRTVTNVGSGRSTYMVRIKAPPHVEVSVEPRKLRFKKRGEKKEFRVALTLKKKTESTTDFVFGWLTWTDKKHHVRSPIAVNMTQVR
ncbi:hypothetical protein LR48_Vigan01g224600, partial [Vigna angularis]